MVLQVLKSYLQNQTGSFHHKNGNYVYTEKLWNAPWKVAECGFPAALAEVGGSVNVITVHIFK